VVKSKAKQRHDVPLFRTTPETGVKSTPRCPETPQK
jgi:hypothetical protein